MSQSTADSDYSSSESYLSKMHQERFNIFKSQDPENEHFDVAFEINGKTILANKLLLTSASEYMNVLLSDRWTRNGEAVKIDDYCYDDFYQFLCFIYTEYCKLNDGNVFQLSDISEIYGIPLLKEFCDNFLSKMQYNVERTDEMVVFCQKYSMIKMEAVLKDFICRNFDAIISTKEFLSYKKSVVEFLSLIDYSSYHKRNEKLFEAVYKWTEQQVIAQKDIEEGEIFDVLKDVKDEFCATFPHISSLDKTMMSIDFLMNFVVENGFDLTPAEFNTVYEKLCQGGFGFRSHYSEKSYFEDVYFLAEKQAMKKREMDPYENFNLADFVKAILSEVILLVEFSKMDKTFVMDFVVAKGILTEEEANQFYYVHVSVRNNGKYISGVIMDNNVVLCVNASVHQCSTNFCRFINAKVDIPSTPSTLKKTHGIDWYLCFDNEGILTFKHYEAVDQSDYLIAEMKSEREFSLTPNETTYFTSRLNYPNNVF